MKKLILFFIFLGACTLLQAQVDTRFPDLEGESLTYRTVSLPEEVQGKYTVLGIAYSKKSEDALKTWFEPVYYQFIYKPDKPSLIAGGYDVHAYFIPMFTGAKRPAYKSVMNKVRKTIDAKLLPHVLFYKGTIKEYKKALNFQGKDVPYFFVLDPEGNIVYTTSGRYTDDKMEEITEYLDEAW